MYKCIHLSRWAILFSATWLLSGCLGGTVAQQIARTIATSVADSAVGTAVDAQEKKTAAGQPTMDTMLYNASADPYRNAMLNMDFTPLKAIQEPLPEYPTEAEEIPIVILKTNPLVQVELFNLLIGEEKLAVLQKARLRGALNLPEPSEWDVWHVATGKIQSSTGNQTLITFLLPPSFGKLASGSIATVELSQSGDLNIARYTSN